MECEQGSGCVFVYVCGCVYVSVFLGSCGGVNYCTNVMLTRMDYDVFLQGSQVQ